MIRKSTLRFAAFAFLVFGVGCATSGQPLVYTETEMELAQQRAEDDTFARLAASNSEEIADAASTLARERARR